MKHKKIFKKKRKEKKDDTDDLQVVSGLAILIVDVGIIGRKSGGSKKLRGFYVNHKMVGVK